MRPSPTRAENHRWPNASSALATAMAAVRPATSTTSVVLRARMPSTMVLSSSGTATVATAVSAARLR
jgi:hypothetical protein